MIRLLEVLVRVLRWITAVVAPGGSTTSPPSIGDVRPAGGWPGSLVSIDGAGFGPELDDNQVTVGGVPALVVRSAPTSLTVLVGEKATSGPVTVSRQSQSATWAGTFTLRPWPTAADVGQPGAPVFTHGPQHGTPALRVKGQRVLAILAHGAGQAPADAGGELFAEAHTFQQAERFWNEASYGRTTFSVQGLPYIPLPKPRNEYVWDDQDVNAARRILLGATRRGAAILGNRAYVAHLGLGLSAVDVSNFFAPVELARVGNFVALDVVASGSRAYVAADTGGLIVMDISATPMTVVTSVALGGRLQACDLSGATLVTAALEGGLETYDLSNPSLPIRRAAVGTSGWASAVRIVGTRAYVGSDMNLQIWDVSNPASPSFLGQASAGEFVMGLDVVGTVCAVATDGNGLALFEVGGLTPIARGSERTVLRLHDVTLRGTIAYASGGDAGLHVVDVANLAMPKSLGVVPTSRPCHDAAIDGTRLLLGVGARTIVPADLASAAKPPLGPGKELGASFPFGIETELGNLRTNLAVARNDRGKLKSDVLFVDALQRAKAQFPTLDFAQYQGFIVVLHGAPGRGSSRLGNKVEFNGNSVVFNESKGLIWLASHTDTGRTTWGRKAHEIGHWFGMVDIYTEWFDDGTYKKGDAEAWDMAGDHDQGALFSAHEADRMRLYEPANIVRRTWNPGVGPQTERFDLVAHHTTEDTTAGRHHLIELTVGGGLIYYIEVRQKPGPVIFDANVPLAPPLIGCVLVTRVTESMSISNTFERPTMLFAVLHPGQSVADAVRLLRIEVESVDLGPPLAYRIAVHWNETPPPTPDGKFDMTITPWSTQTWETPDIWINSPRNDHATPVYEFHEPGDPGRPVLSGDRPWVKRPNTVFARIRNTGVEAVSDVHVTAYITSPPGIGDNGSWRTLASKKIASIPAHGEVIESFEWLPDVDKHTCVSVAIMPKFGEIEPNNNRAQENVARFDSPGASSHLPVILEAEVRSPFSEWRRVDLRVQGLPAGWHAVVDKAWVWVGPKGSAPVTAVIWTDADSPRAERRDIVRLAFPRVEGWTDFDHRYLPIGGILAPIKANRRTTLARFEAFPADGGLRAVGVLIPVANAVPIVIEIADAVNYVRRASTLTDASGQFQVIVGVPPGHYLVQAFSASTLESAEAESPIRAVEVKS